MIAHSTPNPLIDLDAEANLLAGLIARPSAIDAAAQIVNVGDFSEADHGELFDAILLLHEAGKPMGDATLLCRSLADVGCNWPLGRLVALLRDHFTSEPMYEAELIARLAKLRRMQSALEAAAGRCAERGANPSEIARDLADTLLASEATHASGLENAPPVGERVLQAIDSRDREHGLFLGLGPVDECMGKVCPGEMIVLAARPGIGKSALAMQFAFQIARDGNDVLIVSLEMTSEELIQRALCSEAQVNQADIRTGELSRADRAVLVEAQRELPATLHLWSPAAATMAEIRGMARLADRRHKLRLIVIDYMQLIDGARDDRRANRYEQITRISREIKQLAKTIGVPVLALSQLSRAGSDKPQLVHLRESGAIEQDADIVLLLSRDGSEAKLDVAKYRHGETGEIFLTWHGTETRFGEALIEYTNFTG